MDQHIRLSVSHRGKEYEAVSIEFAKEKMTHKPTGKFERGTMFPLGRSCSSGGVIQVQDYSVRLQVRHLGFFSVSAGSRGAMNQSF